MPPELTSIDAQPFPDDEADLVAYGTMKGDDGISTWVRVGSARRNRDGSFNLRLLAVPLTCEVHLRPAPGRKKPRRVSVPAQPDETRPHHLDK